MGGGGGPVSKNYLVSLDPDTGNTIETISDPDNLIATAPSRLTFDSTNDKVWCTVLMSSVESLLIGVNVATSLIDAVATLDQIYTNDVIVADGYVWVTDSPLNSLGVGINGGGLSILKIQPSLVVTTAINKDGGTYPGLIAAITGGPVTYHFTQTFNAAIEDLYNEISPVSLSQTKDMHLVTATVDGNYVHLPSSPIDGEKHTIVDFQGNASPTFPIYIQYYDVDTWTTLATVLAPYSSRTFVYTKAYKLWFEV